MTTAWFVDGGYAYKAWSRVAPGIRMDYGLLRAKIEADADERIREAYYLNSEREGSNNAQDGFHTFLSSSPPRGAGMRVKLYGLKVREEEWPRHLGGGKILHPETGEQYITTTQKGVDVGLAFHLMRSFSKVRWDKLYLCAGDGDFAEVVHHLVENEGVDVTVIGAKDTISSSILPYVRVVWLESMKDDIAR